MQDTNTDLAARAQSDPKAINELIVNNRGLVIYLVQQFVAINPEYKPLQDDLICEGNLALVVAANRLPWRAGGLPSPDISDRYGAPSSKARFVNTALIAGVSLSESAGRAKTRVASALDKMSDEPGKP